MKKYKNITKQKTSQTDMPFIKPKGKVFSYEDNLESGLEAVKNFYSLYDKFPKKVKQLAKEIAFISNKDKQNRIDLTDKLIFTIDGDDSKDFDDAVDIEKTGSGYKLGVHIADVAHYIKQGSVLDKEAIKRGTSVYFPNAVYHMLPHELSSGMCSLKEDEERLCLSLNMDIDSAGHVKSYKIFESVIRSNARLTYKNTSKIIDGDKVLSKMYLPFIESLVQMNELALILKEKRKKRGAIDFVTYESEFEIDGGNVVGLKRADRLNSHYIIEEFMILANETIAEHFNKIKAPFVYRNHNKSSFEKFEKLEMFLHSLGLSHNLDFNNLTSKDIQNFLKNVPEHLLGVVNKVTLRAMSKAIYENKNKGHFGLASEFYCHFTSPIRRYADLMIHRVIKEYLKNNQLANFKPIVIHAAKEATNREILAEAAERKYNDFLKAKYMQDKIGQRFKGIISSIANFGFFVELDNTAEGLVRIESLDGHYEYIEEANILKGKEIFKLGQEVEIEVESAKGDRIDFILVCSL
ncbi:MAG: VacB/RNase II family 3'-5' exoribonuclease [Firmicutes bacterium]|nr:VacB/RNase II family 3'-5' exoribonuclease [Bacillota bacterium]